VLPQHSASRRSGTHPSRRPSASARLFICSRLLDPRRSGRASRDCPRKRQSGRNRSRREHGSQRCRWTPGRSQRSPGRGSSHTTGARSNATVRPRLVGHGRGRARTMNEPTGMFSAPRVGLPLTRPMRARPARREAGWPGAVVVGAQGRCREASLVLRHPWNALKR
jgi:hypothetical protein